MIIPYETCLGNSGDPAINELENRLEFAILTAWGDYEMNGLQDHEKSVIVNQLKAKLDTFAVILFGSAAREQLMPNSDIDIAFLSDRSFEPYELFMVAGDLASELGREVDLVPFHDVSTVLQAHIVSDGILLLDERKSQRQIVFMRALKEYAMLNEARRPILDGLTMHKEIPKHV